MQEKNWLIPLMLALLWFAFYFNLTRSVILSLIISTVLILAMGSLFSASLLVDTRYGTNKIVNPIFYVIFSCMLGGILGEVIYKSTGSKNNWDIIVTLFGLIFGTVIAGFLVFLDSQ